ncbi:hypothetical protein [Streptomyces botrytidirepellens]|uniref:hypothetical protein n=1 Tax=Streptomyces botrytidirepellens TaxID=2486417 RepID=UPI00161DA52A|nr:hypothetical protein [Streptomyces botrytidirepellens]
MDCSVPSPVRSAAAARSADSLASFRTKPLTGISAEMPVGDSAWQALSWCGALSGVFRRRTA